MWFALAIGGLFALEWAALPGGWGGIAPAVGWVLFVPGVILVLAAFVQFKRGTTPVCPFRQPLTLLTDGVFRFSRNPIYLGEILMLAGLAVMLEATRGWVVLPLFWLVLEFLFVRPEEKILKATFGNEFYNYCQRTGRWLGVWRKETGTPP